MRTTSPSPSQDLPVSPAVETSLADPQETLPGGNLPELPSTEAIPDAFQFALSFDRVVEGDALPITITGMLIVFVGLLSITLIISVLPKLLNFLDRQWTRRQARVTSPGQVGDRSMDAKPLPISGSAGLALETTAAIALVVHMELALLRGQSSRITIDESQRQNVWGVVGKMRRLSTRL